MSKRFRYIKSKIKIKDREIRRLLHQSEHERRLAKRFTRKMIAEVSNIEERQLQFKILSRMFKNY